MTRQPKWRTDSEIQSLVAEAFETHGMAFAYWLQLELHQENELIEAHAEFPYEEDIEQV